MGYNTRMSAERYTVGRISEFQRETRGYFLGSFMAERGFPSLNFREVEVAWMRVPTTDESRPHYHLHSTEITIVVSGGLNLIVDQKDSVRLEAGEFIVITPETVLQNLSNDPGTEVMVVKFPSVPNDKYYVE